MIAQATMGRKSWTQLLQSDLAKALIVHAAGVTAGFVVLVMLFQLGILRGIDILFYRGVALAILGTAITAGFVYWLGGKLGCARIGEAISIAGLSFGLNLTFLVLGPITIDRSISVFVLGAMAQEPARAWTSAEVEGVFRDLYLGHYRQIDRRMSEQAASGNVVALGDRYRISERGLAFVRSARGIAWLFETDARFVAPGAKAD